MLCSHCQSLIADNVKRCPFCGEAITIKSRFSLGKYSIIISIISLIWVLILLILLRLTNFGAFSFVVFCANILIILSIISIVLGSIAFFRKTRDILGLLGVFLGLCLLLGLIIGMSLGTSLSYQTSQAGYLMSLDTPDTRSKFLMSCVSYLRFFF